MQSAKLLNSLVETLNPYAGRPVYLDRLHGNHGDALIVMGAEQACRRAGCRIVDTPEEADAIFVVGGAGLSSVWGGAYCELERYYEGSLAAKPLVIFPSTLSFEASDFVDRINHRPGATVLFARERPSLERAQAVAWGPRVLLGLDDDTAFHLRDTDWLQSLKSRTRARHLLIVERRDAESLGGQPEATVRAPSTLKRLAPMWLKRRVKLSSHMRSRTDTSFYRWAVEESERSLGISPKDVPVVPIDISQQSIVSFDRFLSLITDAAAVVTTRLHVGILAALLDKPTVMVGGDRKYAKISGIYQQSMTEMDCVRYFDNPLDPEEKSA
ncbi:polysaccharide pyruvyl transferase family protein [Botrimarina mediterranea]|uniref:Polysaccharide pyruvyl transferase n=1 Tax=Botrimarina mediterranea TaxID=2528022 RepID=A0A518K3G0_9BACT|nr:polysaccharide pyruvyl transferase family protein [Botrimarina mediterranea]QDV72319.1 Polysaccharide pyruvyl transferase [Botrimarina mediterranea]QDV76863.1 Polysaccharide pyruvyl transferase [Planctomycetes bacterium K2D]